jgi:hypothetical protein
MDKIFESAPNIIGEAAKSPLGIFALMVLALSVLGFVFFRRSSERTRTAIFILMFIGVASFGYATFRSASRVLPPATEGGAQAAQGSSVQRAEKDAQEPSSETPTPVERKRPASPSPGSFSTDRDHPTKLRSNEIRGTGVDRKSVAYYFTFLGGPGEVKLTLDFTARGLAQSAHVTLYDEDWNSIGDALLIINPGSERIVKHIRISQQQRVIVEVSLDSFVATAGDFLLRLEGAVGFL